MNDTDGNKGNKNKKILQNISFNIKKDDIVLLMGDSGSGKSTLINLICRLYDLDEENNGTIYINGYKIKDIQIKALRQQISVVPQTVLMFDSTIEQNIVLDDPIPNIKKIDSLIKLMKLPNKLTNGKRLSYGQKQRVLIARTLYDDTKSVYIFDEYLSAVDKETRATIHKHVVDFLRKHHKIGIFISHHNQENAQYNKIIKINKPSSVEKSKMKRNMRSNDHSGFLHNFF